MKRIILLMTIVIGWSFTAFSQGLNNSGLLNRQHGEQEGQKDKREEPIVQNRMQSGSNVYAASSIVQTSIDKSVAYYQHVTKQNGWFIGIGPALTKEQASHLNVVYKFSNKNKTGHWMKLEAIDGYGNLTTKHNISAYIKSEIHNDKLIRDTLISDEWLQKIEKVCKWEFLSDGTGSTVVVERAYDKDNKLIYNYQPVYISSNEIVGSYTDSWGLPAKTYNKNGEEESIFVNIQLDQWGNDSIIKYVDTDGNLLINSVGSYMIKNVCDKRGVVLEKYSLNQVGVPINDIFGICLWKAECDEYGNIRQLNYYDVGGYTTRISEDQSSIDVAGIRYEYDRLHRMISQSFFDGLISDTTSHGVHKIEYTYNNHGQILSIKSRGLDNEPKAYNKHNNKAAFEYYQYDERGHQLSLIRLDVDSTLLNKILNQYKGDYVIRKEEYERVGQDTILRHLETFSPLVNTYYDISSDAYVDSLDIRGNILSRTFVSVDQDPSLPDRSPVNRYPDYSYKRSKYFYSPGNSTAITIFYDNDGKVWNGYTLMGGRPYQIISIDSLLHTIRYTEYIFNNKKGDFILRDNYQEIYDEHFSEVKYKQSLTMTGGIGRSSISKNLYYKAKVDYTPTGKVASIQYLNEFDEPSYAYNDSRYYCYQAKDETGTLQYYDEYKNPIERSIIDLKTEALFVELLNDNGKMLGFHDGDVLIRYGDWFYNHNANSTAKKEFYLQTIFGAAKDSIEIWVLRHFPKENNSKIIKFKIKGRKFSEMGFTVNSLPLTDMEVMRYLKTYMAFREEEEKAGRSIPSIIKNRNHIARIMIPSYRNYLFGESINPVLILLKKNKDSNEWPFSDSQQLYCYGDDNYKYGSDAAIYAYSEDGCNLRCDSISHYVNTEVVWLTEEEHQIAQKLLEQAIHEHPSDFTIAERDNSLYILDKQPSQNAISANEMIQRLEWPGNEVVNGISIFNHVEGVESMVVLSSPFYGDYHDLTYRLNKHYYTLRVMPKDSMDISWRGIAFIHETAVGIDEILFMSSNKLVWAKGNMPFSSKAIIQNYLNRNSDNPADQFNRQDLVISNNPRKYQIASFWQTHQVYKKSIPLLKSLCKQKFGPAYALLADAYTKGEGVPVDTTRAISLYLKAIKTEESVHSELGQLYYETHQYKSALQYFKHNVNKDACYYIGLIYENGGYGVMANPDSAYYYYRKGRLLSQNDEEWEDEFDDATNRVFQEINYSKEDFKELSPEVSQTMSAGHLYNEYLELDELGDYKKAYSFLKAAADSLYPEAEVAMAAYMLTDFLPFHNPDKAHEYLQRAVEHYLVRAQNGDSTAYKEIARLYRDKDLEGKGSNTERAKEYFKMALNSNDYSSSEELGDIYYNEYKYAEALNAYLIGAKGGNDRCKYQTAYLYELGVGGVENNMSEAIFWYRNCSQKAKEKEIKEKANNALRRLGISTIESNLVGIWISNSGMNAGKIFLPNGLFFAFEGKYDISEIRNCTFNPWMIGTYYIKKNNHYVENVQQRNINRYLGEQELTFRIDNDNNIMYASWEGDSESWKRLTDSDHIIEYIMQNWEKYSDYISNKLP